MARINVLAVPGLLAGSASCAPSAPSRCEAEKLFVYDTVGSNVAQVFNVEEMRFHFTSKQAALSGSPTEFGGLLYECDKGRYRCVGWPVDVYVERYLPRQPAKIKNLECQKAVSNSSGYVVQCRGYDHLKIFWISEDHRLIRYSTQGADYPREVYIARGCGISLS